MGVVACRDQKFGIEDVIVLMEDVIDHDRVHMMDQDPRIDLIALST